MLARRTFWTAATAAALTLVVASSSGADTAVTYGVSVSKGCASPTYVGRFERCYFVFGNNNPATTSGDNVVLTSVADRVTTAGGDVTATNLLPSLSLVASPAPPAAKSPTCTGASLSGDGTDASPWVGATRCNLPYGSTLTSALYPIYKTTLADYSLNSSHALNDQATYTWMDRCNKTPTPDTCDLGVPNTNQAPARTTLKLYTPQITTALSASSINAGQSVHDTATVTFDSPPPAVSGTVTYRLYTDSGCTTLSTSPALNQQVTYTGGSVPPSQDVTFAKTGSWWFQATFSGDAADGITGPVSSACTSEPLTVGKASIAIAPSATNEVDAPHTFTVTLQKDAGSGFVPAAGEHVTVTLTDSNGAAHTTPAGSCTSAGPNTDANGQCTISFTSATPGKVTAHASSTLSVNGASVSVDTTGADAVKTFVDANIVLTPPTAFNPVNKPHVFTATVKVNAGDGAGYIAPPDGTLVTFTIVSGPGSFSGGSTCTTIAGSCTVTLSSSTTGTTVVHASTSVTVGGVGLQRATGDAHAGDSDDATKTWRDQTVATTVRDAHDADVTGKFVPTGSVVHDVATVSGLPAAGPVPTGTVTFTLYATGTCSGTVVATGTGSLDAGVARSPDSPSLTTDGSYSYLAAYGGDGNYIAATGPCEPFTIGSPPTPCPAGSFSVTIDPSTGDATIVYDQFPAPNDNSYGVNAVGWPRGHKFRDLVGSDHAGFEVTNASGTDVLDFNIDYLSTTKSGTPSGYASLGPFGGDGKVNKGKLLPADLTWDTSLARDLNTLGYFSGGVQVVGKSVANLLVDSPPTLDKVSNYTLTPAAAAAFTKGWDFHDTYFVTLTGAKLLAIGAIQKVGSSYQLTQGWKIAPNADELHNSPAKPCP